MGAIRVMKRVLSIFAVFFVLSLFEQVAHSAEQDSAEPDFVSPADFTSKHEQEKLLSTLDDKKSPKWNIMNSFDKLDSKQSHLKDDEEESLIQIPDGTLNKLKLPDFSEKKGKQKPNILNIFDQLGSQPPPSKFDQDEDYSFLQIAEDQATAP